MRRKITEKNAAISDSGKLLEEIQIRRLKCRRQKCEFKVKEITNLGKCSRETKKEGEKKLSKGFK